MVQNRSGTYNPHTTTSKQYMNFPNPMIYAIVLLIFIGFAFGSNAFSDNRINRTAYSLLETAKNRIQHTSYQNIRAEYFPLEQVDVDLDGRSHFETCSYTIENDRPHPGMKTIIVTCSWPILSGTQDSTDGFPDLKSASIALLVDHDNITEQDIP